MSHQWKILDLDGVYTQEASEKLEVFLGENDSPGWIIRTSKRNNSQNGNLIKQLVQDYLVESGIIGIELRAKYSKGILGLNRRMDFLWPELDLHGCRRDAAIEQVQNFLIEHANSPACIIITGKGIHSVNGMPVIKPRIEEHLDEGRVKWIEDPRNEGRLIVFNINLDVLFDSSSESKLCNSRRTIIIIVLIVIIVLIITLLKFLA